MVTETSTKLTGLLATLDQSFPGAVLSYPLVSNQRVLTVFKEVVTGNLLHICYRFATRGVRTDRAGRKQDRNKWLNGNQANRGI